MDDKIILGIHSQLTPETQRSGNAAERFMDGHAWLTVTRNGKTEAYGLWPDNHPRVTDNGDGTDILVGMERRFRSDAERFIELSPEQARKLESTLKANVTWSPTTTCAGWASDTVTSVTGRKLDATEFMLIETPRELIRNIREQERVEPTALDKPRAPIEPEKGSSSSLSEAASERTPAYAGLHASSVDAVARLDAQMGRQYHNASACMAGSLACLAKQNGFDRIDHAMLSIQSEQTLAGERVFIVQGDPADPAKRRAHMSTQEAVSTPVEKSMTQLAALEQTSPQRTQEQQVPQTQSEALPQRKLV